MDYVSCPQCGNMISRVMCPSCQQISENIQHCDKCGATIGYIGCQTCNTVMDCYGTRYTGRRSDGIRKSEMEFCIKRAAIIIPVSLIALLLLLLLLGGI